MTNNPCIIHKKQAIQQWITAVYATYPLETVGFMRTQQDKFSNPVGHTIQIAAEQLYAVIIEEEVDIEKTYKILLELIKIRAVQNFNPEQAVGIIQLYKPILQRLFLKEGEKKISFQEYLNMESKIDSLILIAFNIYMKEREKVYEQRVAEQKRQTQQLQRLAKKYNFITEKSF